MDIGQKGATRREHRELRAWQSGVDQSPAATYTTGQGQGDEVTFGIGSNTGTSWDQFAVNEKLFGVTATYDEDVYTTRIDRSGPDFKDRERQAQKIANEITGVRFFFFRVHPCRFNVLVESRRLRIIRILRKRGTKSSTIQV